MKRIIILVLLSLLTTFGFSQKRQLEKYYQNIFADVMHGKTEIVLEDGARVDIVTDTFAIEVDFAKKWAESIGQALYYADVLNKKAGILLVIDARSDDKYVQRLMKIATKNDITVWVMFIWDDSWSKVDVITEYKY